MELHIHLCFSGTGALGFTTIALSTMMDMGQKEMSSAGHLRVMWSFGLACLVFTLYITNGKLSCP